MNATGEGARRLRILVIYYSRGGRTRQVAKKLAEALADQHEVTVAELRSGRPLSLISALLLTRRRRPAQIQPLTIPDSVDLVYLGAPIWAGQVHAMAWGYLQAGIVAAPHVLFATSSGGDNDTGGMRWLEQAIAARGRSVMAVVDMNSPAMLGAKLPVLVEAARRLANTRA
jgi:flavodoxin